MKSVNETDFMTSNNTSAVKKDYTSVPIREFIDSKSAETAAFLQTKIVSLCELLFEFKPKSMTDRELRKKIAKKGGFASENSVEMMMRNWGSNAK